VPFAKRAPALAATQGKPLEEKAVSKIAQTNPTSRPAPVKVVKSQNVQNIKPQKKTNDIWWNQQQIEP
jgi:hypothetical protein